MRGFGPKISLLAVLLLALPCAAVNDFTDDATCVAVYYMESMTAGDSVVASASSEYSASYRAWQAFQSTGAPWRSNSEIPCSVTITFGTQYRAAATSYAFTTYSSMTTSQPNAWTLEGYNGSTWTTLDTQTGITWTSAETKTYSFSNSTAYEAYRMSITAANGAGWAQVHNWRLYTSNGELMEPWPLSANTTTPVQVEDTQGDNDLWAYGTTAAASPPDVNAVAQQGSYSTDWEAANGHRAHCLDEDLDSSFPLKYGTTNKSFTYTAWIRPESGAATYPRTICGKGGSGGTTKFTQLYTLGSSPVVVFRVHDAAVDRVLTGTSTLVFGQWYYVAATYEYTSDDWRLYVWDDTASSAIENLTQTESIEPVIDRNPFVIGGGDWENSNYFRSFDGLIDEVTVWNRALTLDEIEDVRDGTFEGTATGGQILRLGVSP